MLLLDQLLPIIIKQTHVQERAYSHHTFVLIYYLQSYNFIVYIYIKP